jgi:hypothetical protein
MTRLARTVLAAAVAVVFVAGLAGAAHGFWRTSGSGSATATSATLETVTVEATTAADTASRLQPGGTADVVLRVHNPNPYAVQVVSVALTGAVTAEGGIGPCATTGVTFTDPGSGATLAPGTQVLVLAGAASMGSAADSGCQGATFHIPVTLTVRT